MSTYYIHKEPVLDGKRCVFGNELSFRRGPALCATESDVKWSTMSVDGDVAGAVSSGVGFEKLTGSKRTFLDLDVGGATGDILALLPKNSVFQISERDALDKEILLKAAMLQKQAYQIVLDYTPSGRGPLPLHRIADFVRINASSIDSVASTVALFRGLPARLIGILFSVKQTDRRPIISLRCMCAAKDDGVHATFSE